MFCCSTLSKARKTEKAESKEGELIMMKKLLAVCLVIALVAFAAPVFAASSPILELLDEVWLSDTLSQLSQCILLIFKTVTSIISLF